jgi:hypothetical protein
MEKTGGIGGALSVATPAHWNSSHKKEANQMVCTYMKMSVERVGRECGLGPTVGVDSNFFPFITLSFPFALLALLTLSPMVYYVCFR